MSTAVRRIDINCDMGESYGRYSLGNDRELMPLITSANIACGLHAGDWNTMQATVRLAHEQGVLIGVHPGYPDLQGFGRRAMNLAADEVEAMVLYQIGALAGFTRGYSEGIHHVKPHGALYNQAARDRKLAGAIAAAVKRFSPSLILVGLAGSEITQAGKEAGLRTAEEGFPERGYEKDGSLRSRNLPGALIEDPQAAAQQAVRLALDGIDFQLGETVSKRKLDTLCIHGDSPLALQIIRAVRVALEAAEVQVEGF